MGLTRTFVAVPMETHCRNQVAGLLRKLQPGHGEVRWVDPENLHLTLAFLGDVDDRLLGGLGKAVADGVRETDPFEVQFRGVGAFPTKTRPNVLWIGVEEGRAELTGLHEIVELALEPFGYRPEARAYSPHVTLGRVKRGARASKHLIQTLSELALWSTEPCRVDRVEVMASALGRQGPTYTVLATCPLNMAAK